MANALEMTFKNLQSDERYKKLERTLKMALLKNAERRSSADSGNAGTWPNVSSINGDHWDNSLTAASVHSSRISSEVVSSSTNLRNILLNKRRFGGPLNNVATSSENQFPTHKDSDDSAMMPPPRTPGVDLGRKKIQRLPLSTMPVSSGRNTNGFSVSTPASSISSIPKCAGTASVKASTVFPGNDDYHGRNGYAETDEGNTRKEERNFSRWRVLLNDKGMLIIKGTLDCGKVARSKPVIRRLAPTSVQSIFKHTYHLQGNLVDERDELPDYVRGKFYNGFPDDWENVYQVWRNFVNDGNRLSFRWPTAVTDSDDDIKSGVTEISYRPERPTKPLSPRKRNRSGRSSPSLAVSSAADTENRPESKSCARLANGSVGAVKKSRNNCSLPENFPRSRATSNRAQDPCKSDEMPDDKSQSHNDSAASLNTTDKSSVNSLANYLSEDKLNTIIDNLTDKNCPLEYIDKIVQMFDCMKYVASYQSSAENETVKGAVIAVEKKTTQSPRNKNRSTEERNRSMEKKSSDVANASKNRVNTPRPAIQKLDHGDDSPSPPSGGKSAIDEKSHGNHMRRTRRHLTNRDYESSESDDDSYDDSRRSSTQRFSASNERLGKTRKLKNHPTDPVNTRTSRKYTDPGKSSNDPRLRSAVRNRSIHDSSISDEEFTVKRKHESKSANRAYASPRKFVASRKEHQREIDIEYYDSSISVTEDEEQNANRARAKIARKENYDSSVSITEDESRRTERTRANIARKENYDSSVSITEDERCDVRARNSIDSRRHNAEPISRPPEPQTRGIGDNRDDRKRNDLNYYAEAKSRPAEQNIARNGDNRDARKRLVSLDYNSDSQSRPVDQDIRKIGNVSGDRRRQNFLPSAQDAGRNSSLTQLRSKANANRELAEIESQPEFRQSPESPDSPPAKSKTPQVRRKANGNRELAEIESQPEFQQSPESPDSPPAKIKTPQVRKKPIVISSEPVDINLKAYGGNGRKEIDKNAGNTPRKFIDGPKASNAVKNDSIGQKSSVDLPEPAKIAEPVKPNTRSKDSSSALKVQDGKSSARENKSESAANVKSTAVIASAAEYGTEENPKLLTAWVPAVICDDDGDKKCHLIFEGKLLNEAGHVANRKFETDAVRRRLSPKIIETVNHEFFKLVGDLNDTKHVVPKELIKLCHSGCPGRIGNFCDRWKSLTGEIYKSPPQDLTHNNTSVDCLSVPRSSRGRRILPPLNYWSGERVVTRDNKTMYSPGNSQESSIPSSLETTGQEVRRKKKSPKPRPETKRTNESGVTETKKKAIEVEKISTPGKSAVECPTQAARGSQKSRAGKRRLSRNLQVASSESDDDAEIEPTPRKRKPKANNKEASTKSTKKLTNSEKNPSSPQSPEKTSGPEVKAKNKKRQKIDDNQSTLQQFVTRRPTEVTCTYIKNVPMHDGDLSEDQLSTM